MPGAYASFDAPASVAYASFDAPAPGAYASFDAPADPHASHPDGMQGALWGTGAQGNPSRRLVSAAARRRDEDGPPGNRRPCLHVL
ncbi:hypothetical protein [Streptomyces sp. OP7]|uniref:hypothetical protein n=1 Tax=Streptomyces sp. OP7 TaxID=3142462 RepID=UPI0032E91508